MARPDTGKKISWGAANTIAVALTLIPVLMIPDFVVCDSSMISPSAPMARALSLRFGIASSRLRIWYFPGLLYVMMPRTSNGFLTSLSLPNTKTSCASGSGE